MNGLRQMMREAVEGARDTLLNTQRELSRGGTLSDEEAMRRYVQQHQGRPDAILEFTSRHATGGDVLQEAVDYERRMEQMLQEQGGV